MGLSFFGGTFHFLSGKACDFVFLEGVGTFFKGEQGSFFFD